jgi:hypothetical protein
MPLLEKRLGRIAVVGVLAAGVAPVEGGEWRDRIAFILSWRLRGEAVDYFRPPAGAMPEDAHRYAFLGSQLRAGVRVTLPHFQLVLEAQDTRLFDVPDDASLPAPFGNLGPGATYFANTPETNQGAVFFKQGLLTFRRSGFAASAGRFEHSDGLETVPAEPSLAWLKRSRLAERLVGPFGYTHVTRSFDGLRLAYDRARWNLTALATRPTHGGYEVEANPEFSDVDLAGVALTAKPFLERFPIDLRAFYLYYEDGRPQPVKVDNRPLAVRQLDKEAIRVHSIGGHAATVVRAGPGAIDALAWGLGQTGTWGRLDHSAWAFAFEAGYQLAGVGGAPWVRFGWNRSSGDDDPTDGTHRTFVQIIPTPRPYAQFPFYNLMNGDDRFIQLLLFRATDRVSLRADFHWLRLTEAADLWYAGGGATNERIFGFSGVPARGGRDLARVLDLGLTARLHAKITAYAYFGRAFGGDVVARTFAGENASFGYLELTFRR